MGVDISNTATMEAVLLDESHDLHICRNGGDLKVDEAAKKEASWREISESKLANHKGVHENIARSQALDHFCVAVAQMIDPDRSVD